MQPPDAQPTKPSAAAMQAELASHSLMDTFITRRSRRFATRQHPLRERPRVRERGRRPSPLSLEEEAVIAFAASGVTGQVGGELPYRPDAGPETGGGQVMMSLVGPDPVERGRRRDGDAVHHA